MLRVFPGRILCQQLQKRREKLKLKTFPIPTSTETLNTQPNLKASKRATGGVTTYLVFFLAQTQHD